MPIGRAVDLDDVDVMGARYGGRRRRGGRPGGTMSLLQNETLSGLPKEVHGFARSVLQRLRELQKDHLVGAYVIGSVARCHARTPTPCRKRMAR